MMFVQVYHLSELIYHNENDIEIIERNDSGSEIQHDVYKGGTWEYIKFFPFPFYPLDFGLDPWFGANNISLKRNVFTPHLVNL